MLLFSATDAQTECSDRFVKDVMHLMTDDSTAFYSLQGGIL